MMKVAPIGCVWRHGVHHQQKFGLGSLVNLAWLVGSFYVTSLLFVVVILGLWRGCAVSRCSSCPLPQGRG